MKRLMKKIDVFLGGYGRISHGRLIFSALSVSEAFPGLKQASECFGGSTKTITAKLSFLHTKMSQE